MLLTAKQVKERLNVSKHGLESLMESGRLKPINSRKPGAKKFYPLYEQKDVETYRREQTANVPKRKYTKHNVVENVTSDTSSSRGLLTSIITRLDTLDSKLDKLLSTWS